MSVEIAETTVDDEVLVKHDDSVYVEEGIRQFEDLTASHAPRRVGGVALRLEQVNWVPDGNLLERFIGRRSRMIPFGGRLAVTGKLSPLIQHN